MLIIPPSILPVNVFSAIPLFFAPFVPKITVKFIKLNIIYINLQIKIERTRILKTKTKTAYFYLQ